MTDFITVFGGTGFIGRHLLPLLLEVARRCAWPYATPAVFR
jgi:uncharacterized protein YbjT (DUF2867 family)